MLAVGILDVDELNQRERARLSETGELQGPAFRIGNNRAVQRGDRVVTLRNDYDLDVRNGTLATVAKAQKTDREIPVVVLDRR